MSARLEAAVKAWDRHWGDRYGDEAVEEMGEEVGVALAAADDVMFSESAVQRAAQAIYRHIRNGDPSMPEWEGVQPRWKANYVAEARAVIASLQVAS